MRHNTNTVVKKTVYESNGAATDGSAPVLPLPLPSAAAPVDHGDGHGVHEVVDFLPNAVDCVGGHEEVPLVQVL